MIRVDRDRVARPAVLDLDDPDSPAAREVARAIAHIEDPENNPEPKFEVYRHDSVKIALIELFGGKCAYCESDHLAATSSDIEHFRPKGRIDPGTGKEKITPGYYWLAATWENLLLSCPSCNRSKRQLERDELGEIDFAEEASGKIDQFPLTDETLRVLRHTDDLTLEDAVRLLLDPCIDPVEEHFEFDQEGNIFPRQVDGELSAMGKTSIEVYALDRWPLVKARKEKYLDMVKAWDNIQLAAQMLEQLDAEQHGFVFTVIDKNQQDLEAFTVEDREFAGMARCLIVPLRQELERIHAATARPEAS